MNIKKRFFLLLLLLPVLAFASDGFFDQVNYKGAFGSSNWLKGWTALDHYEYLADDAVAAGTVPVTDASINAGETVYWTADNTYVLEGFVFVEDGAVLNIQAGTVIKAKAGQGESASALIVSQGGKIYAEGTATAPVIFTAENDDVTDPYDLELPATNLWGGLIILGKATVNNKNGGGNIEGIPVEERTYYGGTDDDDCSGVLRYVSIRHGGTDIGSGDEINGLTLGAVGRGTTIEYVEVFSNNDDGFEWFGGTVNAKYLVSAFNLDDAFDHDEGLQSKMQFLFVVQDSTSGERCGEHDGGTDPEDGEPYAHPVIYNATYLGSGMNATASGNDHLFKIRDNWGGEYKNCIFGDFAGDAMDVEDLESGHDSRERLETGDISFLNNIWFDFAKGNSWDVLGTHDWESAYLADAANNNELTNPALVSISRAQDKSLDPRPAADGAAYQNLADIPDDGFFTKVNYKGAFGSSNWLKGWTALDHYGYLADDAVAAGTVPVTDASINAGETVYWTADNTYVLEGFVFVEDGAVLNIQAGTVIKAKAGQGESASALIVSQGGKIYAEGTATAPVIFTAENDDVTDPYDLELPATNLWGGLIILGKATVNNKNGGGNIEGIPVEERTYYGGTDDDDCSGVLRYVSIRHGGTDIGSGDEINGLTLGAVGRGTTIEYVEVFSNNDDGFEWFGGTVNAKYLVSAFNLDDAFDHDEGLQSKMQFLFVVQDSTSGERCGEHDGGTDPEDGEPYAHPVIYNATYLGSGMNATASGNDHLFKIRDNWGGEYKNCIFGDFAGDAMDVEDLESGHDSRERLETGDISFLNNIWFDFAKGNSWDVLGTHDWESAYLADAANNNELTNPALVSISRAQDKSLDPRPAADGAAYQNLADISTAVESIRISTSGNVPQDYILSQNYPNPFNPTTTIEFSLLKAGNVKLTVFNQLGQEVAVLANDVKLAGTYKVTWNASHLPSGLYLYRLESAQGTQTQKMLLVK